MNSLISKINVTKVSQITSMELSFYYLPLDVIFKENFSLLFYNYLMALHYISLVIPRHNTM